MKIFALTLLTMGLLTMAGCNQDTTHNVDLVNTYWKLTDIKGTAVTASDKQREAHIVLNAEEQRVTGSDGCNRMMGGYTALDGNKLQFTQMAGTRMACMEGAEQAQLISTSLAEVTAYKITGDQLELHDASGALVARFQAVALQ